MDECTKQYWTSLMFANMALGMILFAVKKRIVTKAKRKNNQNNNHTRLNKAVVQQHRDMETRELNVLLDRL